MCRASSSCCCQWILSSEAWLLFKVSEISNTHRKIGPNVRTIPQPWKPSSHLSILSVPNSCSNMPWRKHWLKARPWSPPQGQVGPTCPWFARDREPGEALVLSDKGCSIPWPLRRRRLAPHSETWYKVHGVSCSSLIVMVDTFSLILRSGSWVHASKSSWRDKKLFLKSILGVLGFSVGSTLSLLFHLAFAQ